MENLGRVLAGGNGDESRQALFAWNGYAKVAPAKQGE